MTRRMLARVVVTIVCSVSALASCAKDPLRVDRNRPPQTYLVAAPAESSGASYKIHLYWRGEDPDGYISGFLWAWDDSTVGAFRFTTKTDSIFELTVNDSSTLFGGGTTPPGQTRPHTFYIRAVDNLGKADPNLTFFNRRVYKATTDKPSIRFVGAIPSGASIDTLCDNQPFSICWTGSDTDGYVNYYRWDVGILSSNSLSADTCVVFNNFADPESEHLISGVYTFTVTAVDNAFARSDPASGGRFLFVVNNDPETKILPQSISDPRPVGFYRQPFENGQVANSQIDHPFFEGDTIPFRSTVWFRWEGFDDACDSPQGVSGYSAVFRGTRNGGDPYITGVQNFLCDRGASGGDFYFTTNNPDSLQACGFQSLVLDSVDAGFRLLFNVSSRDNSGRADGTPAAFQFNSNFPPRAISLTVSDTVQVVPGQPSQPAKLFRWVGLDREDGGTVGAQLSLDGTETRNFSNVEFAIIPESTFRGFSPENPHTVELRVLDRAGYLSDETLSVTFNVTYPPGP